MKRKYLELRLALRQKYLNYLGRKLLKSKFSDERVKAKMQVLLDKQMADRAKLGVKELPAGGFVIWGE